MFSVVSFDNCKDDDRKKALGHGTVHCWEWHMNKNVWKSITQSSLYSFLNMTVYPIFILYKKLVLLVMIQYFKLC